MLGQGSYTRNAEGQGGREIPLFYLDPIPDEAASAREGRLIAHDVEHIKIIIPGNSLTQWAGRVTDEHRRLWPEEYKAFKEGRELARHGTPLEMWPLMRPSQVAMLKSLGIGTVEDMAGVDDYNLQRLGMGAKELRDAAKAFLDDAEAASQNTALTAENERLTSEIAALRNQMEEQGQLLAQVHAQMLTMKDAPNPLMVHIPGQHDPVEQAHQGRWVAEKGAPAEAAFAEFAEMKRRPGRPRKDQEAAA